MPLEFQTWELGKPQSYAAQFGLEDGLCANDSETFVAPAFPPPPFSRLCWQDRVPEFSAGAVFDQAWLGLVHARYSEDFCGWLQEHVPIRLGLLFESMSYTPAELSENAALAGREAHVFRQIRSLGLTHVLCADERDAAVIQDSGVAQALWYPSALPERFVAFAPHASKQGQAAFFGNLYSARRRQFAQHPRLQEWMALPQGAETATSLPSEFDALHVRVVGALVAAKDHPNPDIRSLHLGYVEELRRLRRAIFQCWMGGLPDWTAIVNLPSYFKGYAGRVFEAMTAGVPAVSWRVPERPRTLALFEEGREILLFDEQNPDELAEHLTRLAREPDRGRRIAQAAHRRFLARHTSERRVAEILAWVEKGVEPRYDG